VIFFSVENCGTRGAKSVCEKVLKSKAGSKIDKNYLDEKGQFLEISKKVVGIFSET